MTIPKEMLLKAAIALYVEDGYSESCWPLESEKRQKPYFLKAEAALTAALAQQWRPIETAPTMKPCLIWWDNGPDAITGIKAVNGSWYVNGYRREENPTYWMPLPPPPTASDSREK